MELRHYLQVVLKGWWLVLPTILIALSAALVFTYTQPPIYRTTATFVVSPSAYFATLDDVLRGWDSLSRRDGVMSTYVAIATSSTVLDAVYKEMELTEEQIKYIDVSSELVPSTNIVKVAVEADDPLVARRCANLVGEKTIEYGLKLYEIYDMKPLDPAYLPREPDKPRKVQNLILATILGSVAGVGLAFLLQYIRVSRSTVVGIDIIDSDTGIYNRHYFLQRLGEELSRAKRQRYPLSLALVNIERLDMIADMRVPRLKNEALRRVAVFLRGYLREEDLLARYRGETFAVLFPDTPGLDAKQILEKLHTRMEWSIIELEEAGVKLNLTATSGVVTYDFNSTSREELLNKAEKTLQRARDDGYGEVLLLEEDEDS